MFISGRRMDQEEDGKEAVSEEEEEDSGDGNGGSCGKGHGHEWSLPPATESSSFCVKCFIALVSDQSSPSLHLSHALSRLSLAVHLLPSSLSLLLAPPLVRSLFSLRFAADDPISCHLTHLISALASAHPHPLSGRFVAHIADRLAAVVSWTPRHVHSLHCFGVLLDNQQNDDLSSLIRDKMSLFCNLVAGLRLPSEEVRGEILFILYKLSDSRATPWDDAEGNDGADSSLAEVKLLLLRLALEALLKTRHDDVRMNCLVLLIVSAQRGFLDDLFADGRGFGETNNLMQTDEAESQTPLVNLFLDAVKSPLLSSDTEVQIKTLDLIFHSLSSTTNCAEQAQAFVEENIADYVFEILRLSGNKDSLVISCLQVLTLLSTAQETFKQRLAIGFPALLSVLGYVSEIPLHPVQSQVLQLVWRCILDCSSVISMPQIEEIALILTKIFRRHTVCDVDLHSETLILACSTFVEVLKSPSAAQMQKLAVMVQEAVYNFVLSAFSSHQGSSNQLLFYALYLLKAAYTYSLDNTNSQSSKLESSIVETCKTYLLPWLERAADEGEEEEVVLDVLETFHLILLRGSEVETHNFALALASASWFSFSFRCLGLFPSDEMKSRIYLMLSSVLDRSLGHESGQPIRDAYVHLPSDPLELLFLLGLRSSYDHELTCCQRAVLLILYASSLYGGSLADDNQLLASLEQYVIVNSGDFSCGAADSTMLTQLVHLYGLVRGTPIGRHRTPYSPDAEKGLFHLIAEQEWDILKMSVHPVSLKWLLQQEEIMSPLSNQILNFCRLYSTKQTQISFRGSEIQTIDIPMVAELVVSADNNMTSLLVSLLKQVHEDRGEDDVTSVVNVITGVLDIYPDASNQFCSQGICDALRNIYSSIHPSSQIILTCSLLVFKILSSANSKTISEDGEWFSVTVKFVEILNARLASRSCGEEGCLVMGILCLILQHSTRHVLKEASMAILWNKSLMCAVDCIIQTVCAKGPSLIDPGEAGMGDCLTFVLLLYFFSLKSLFANFQETLDWQDFLQSSDDGIQRPSVICIKCHDLCRLIYFGSSLVKLVASQCLVEVLTRISDHLSTKHDELQCSSSYLESMMAVTEGLVLYGDCKVAMNCAMCLSIMLRWEKLGLPEMRAIRDSKWPRLIVEELLMTLAVPGLASKYLSNQHKPAAHIVAALLRMDKLPKWARSVFDDTSCISGIIDNVSASNVSPEMVMLLRELMNNKYLNKEHIARLHHLFQVCRKQVYEDTMRAPCSNQSLEIVAGANHDDTGELCRVLLHHMVYPIEGNKTTLTDHNRLLEEIDMFFHESST